jgi:DNA-binding response OmpR family regulator
VTKVDPPQGVLGRLAPADPGVAPAAPGSSVDVLLVHCDEAFAASMSDVLRRHAFTVLVTGSTEQALEALRLRCTPRLVIVDHDDPSAGVRESVQRLRAEPACSDSGFVALTLAPGVDPGAMGVDEMVLRPVDVGELLSTVARNCGRL